MKTRKLTTALAMSAAAGLVLAGCSGDAGNGGGDEGNGGAEDRSITIGYIEGWTDGQAMAYLAQNQLEALDYDVTITTLTDNGPMYAGLSQGDIDVFASAWPEVTQASYFEQYEDDLESLGVWYDNAVLTIAVPEYSQLTSMDELADNGDLFGNEIIGIEPGAGLTEVTQDSMMPAYGLEDWNLATSSTAAMLTVLGDAIDNQEEIVVTLWRPFWAYAEYDVRDLEDPQGAMGEPEGLHFLANSSVSGDHPEVAETLGQIQLDDDAFGALESLITSEDFEGDTEGAVEQWISENADAYPGLITE